MKLLRRIFDQALVLEPSGRADQRGTMTAFPPEELQEMIPDLTIREQRVYTMPEPHTFFGIHFQDEPVPQAKLITVIHGSGLDYVVDLRKDSPTYKQWEAIKLDAEKPLIVYIPVGFGHAFLSLEKDTVQVFAADQKFVKGKSRSIHYKDPEIGLELPYEDLILSEQDQSAPYLSEIEK